MSIDKSMDEVKFNTNDYMDNFIDVEKVDHDKVA